MTQFICIWLSKILFIFLAISPVFTCVWNYFDPTFANLPCDPGVRLTNLCKHYEMLFVRVMSRVSWRFVWGSVYPEFPAPQVIRDACAEHALSHRHMCVRKSSSFTRYNNVPGEGMQEEIAPSLKVILLFPFSQLLNMQRFWGVTQHHGTRMIWVAESSRL